MIDAGLEVRQSSVFKKPTDKTSNANESEKKNRGGGGDDSHRRLLSGVGGDRENEARTKSRGRLPYVRQQAQGGRKGVGGADW